MVIVMTRISLVAPAACLLFGTAALAQPIDGGALFKQRCQGCHAIARDQPADIGPNLAGVVGRAAAGTGYAYSPALKASGLRWDAATLDRYLAGPARLVPGTKMPVAVSDPAQRAAIIAYLATRK